MQRTESRSRKPEGQSGIDNLERRPTLGIGH
jgi:hypothetical protein